MFIASLQVGIESQQIQVIHQMMSSYWMSIFKQVFLIRETEFCGNT